MESCASLAVNSVSSHLDVCEEVPAVGSLEALAIAGLLIAGCGVLLHALLPAAVLPGACGPASALTPERPGRACLASPWSPRAAVT